MFKHWKEADAKVNQLKQQLEGLDSEIKAVEVEARSEEISVEKRDELINDVTAKVTSRDQMQAEYNDAVEARDRLKASEERQMSLLNSVSTPRVSQRTEAASGDVLESRSYEMAWAKYIKTGNDTEVRGLISTQSGSATEGTDILVPRTLVQKIEDRARKSGKILNLCSIVAIKGITQYPVAGNRTDPELHDETSGIAKKEKDLQFYSVAMEPQFIAEILRVTRKFEEDSVEAFWDWLMAELPDALIRTIDKKVLSGGQSAKDGIHGILTNTNPEFVATLANHALNFNTANSAVALLDDGAEDNATIAMHRSTFFNNVMGLKDTTGRPIWTQMSDDTDKRPTFVMGGYPVMFTQVLPEYDKASADEPYMIVGDFAAFTLNFPKGMSPNITRDAVTEMHNNLVRFLNEIYVAGNITRPGCFTKVTK